MSVERINKRSTGVGRLCQGHFDIVGDTVAEIKAEIAKFHELYPPAGYIQHITKPERQEDGRWQVSVSHALSCD